MINNLLAVLCLTAALTTAMATPVYFCNNGPGIDLVTNGCISGEASGYPGGGDGIYSNTGGGDPESAVEAAILGATGFAVDITLFGKSDDNPALFTFTPDPLSGAQSGIWSVIDGTPIDYITIKAANSFALYQVGGASSGIFDTLEILNEGGQQPDVSHISFWTGGLPNDPPNDPAPEPATWMMAIGGLLGVGLLRRFRRTVRSAP
ncbi:MAG: hypothetical protein JJE04_16100 [Acidobacteriia bacterium]|nr:hypothetical protein [Terriglobia bacterium]